MHCRSENIDVQSFVISCSSFYYIKVPNNKIYSKRENFVCFRIIERYDEVAINFIGKLNAKIIKKNGRNRKLHITGKRWNSTQECGIPPRRRNLGFGKVFELIEVFHVKYYEWYLKILQAFLISDSTQFICVTKSYFHSKPQKQ